MANALSVGLLGGFTLTADGEVVDLPAGSQRLIALLALAGPASRSRLAGTLWPETSQDRALAGLRTAIWRVNTVTDGLVRVRGVTVELGAFVDVDVRRLVRAGRAALRDGASEDVDAVADAGDLLPDWGDEWLLADRERLRQLRLHVLEAVAGRLSRAGRHGLALDTAIIVLCADPLRESAHRTIIGIHLAEGNVAEARRALDACHRTLRHEAGVEPSPALWDLAERAAGRGPAAVTPMLREVAL